MPNLPRWFELPKQAAAPQDNASTPVIVVGAGLAGCHCAYELACRNVQVILIDAGSVIASGASGNNSGIVKPFVTRTPNQLDQFYESAFEFLLRRFESDPALKCTAQFNQCGVLQLVDKLFPECDLYDYADALKASEIAGVSIEKDALYFPSAGWLNPAALCTALVQHDNIDVRLGLTVSDIARVNSGWCVSMSNNSSLQCDTLILANGERINRFAQTKELPITAARGQTSRYRTLCESKLQTIISDKHYIIPLQDSVVVGASFIRGNNSTEIRDADHQQNFRAVQSLLPTLQLDATPIDGFCATRATTPDRLPIVGPVPLFSKYRTDYALIKDGLSEERFPFPSYQQGLYAIGGFGSRGIVSAPYCAHLLVNHLFPHNRTEQTLTNTIQISFDDWSTLLHPARFVIRKLKRGGI